MKRNVTNALILAALVVTTPNISHAADVANSRVELGIQALKVGDYRTALHWLQSAQAREANHSDLPNALGLVYLGLDQPDTAETYFTQALNTPRKHEAAYYLGQIALKQGDQPKAEKWLKQAAEQYEDLEVQQAADQALLKLELHNAASTTLDDTDVLRRFALLAVEAGETRGLVNPDDTSGEDDSDTSVSLLVAGSTTLTPTTNPLDWKLGGSLYTERYSTFSSYDIDGYSIFSSIALPFTSQSPELKLSASRFNLDGEPYLDQLELALKKQWLLGDARKLIVQGRLFNVDSPEDTYQYYAGQLAELGAELRGGQSPKWRLGMTWRTENRDDLDTALSNSAGDNFNGFTSYSRDWLKLRGRVDWNWTQKWRQKLEVSWRYADYHDADQYLADSADTALTEQNRETTRWQVKAELSRSLTPSIDVNFKVEHLEDDSNNDSYDFDSQSVSAGLSYLF